MRPVVNQAESCTQLISTRAVNIKCYLWTRFKLVRLAEIYCNTLRWAVRFCAQQYEEYLTWNGSNRLACWWRFASGDRFLLHYIQREDLNRLKMENVFPGYIFNFIFSGKTLKMLCKRFWLVKDLQQQLNNSICLKWKHSSL